jgi:hypothetical protein
MAASQLVSASNKGLLVVSMSTTKGAERIAGV